MTYNHENEEGEQIIRKVLDEARPSLQQDGGDVEFVSWSREDAIVYIRFLGECASCPLNIMTLQAGIQSMMKIKVPGVERVMMVGP